MTPKERASEIFNSFFDSIWCNIEPPRPGKNLYKPAKAASINHVQRMIELCVSYDAQNECQFSQEQYLVRVLVELKEMKLKNRP